MHIPAGVRKAAITSPPPKFPAIHVILPDFSSPCAWGHILLGEGGQYLVPSSLQDAKRRSFEILAGILLQMGKVRLWATDLNRSGDCDQGKKSQAERVIDLVTISFLRLREPKPRAISFKNLQKNRGKPSPPH